MSATPTRSDDARPAVAFVAWAPVPGRSRDIAGALGGIAWCDYDERWRGWRTPPRYLRSTIRQLRWLRRRRPRAVIATNPPVFCGLGAYAYARSVGVPFVLDSHPMAFADNRGWLTVVLRPIHVGLARRARAVLVTADEPAAQVRAWGGSPLVIHEPPGAVEPAPRPTLERPLVAFVGTFAADEPVDQVIEAARRVPEVDIAVTGRLSRAPAGLVDAAPTNVSFVGWLDEPDYLDLLRRSTAVISLTTRATSVMRSAYESVYADRPLIVTDTPVLRSLFPEAVCTNNAAPSLAGAIRKVLADLPELDARAEHARARQSQRWDAQLAALREAIDEAAVLPARLRVVHGSGATPHESSP